MTEPRLGDLVDTNQIDMNRHAPEVREQYSLMIRELQLRQRPYEMVCTAHAMTLISAFARQRLLRENPDPTDEEILTYLSGNLCRCSGYEGQLRGIQNFIAWKKAQAQA